MMPAIFSKDISALGKLVVVTLTTSLLLLIVICAEARPRFSMPRFQSKPWTAPNIPAPASPAARATILQENIKKLSEYYPESKISEVVEKDPQFKKMLEIPGVADQYIKSRYPDVTLQNAEKIEFTSTILDNARTTVILPDHLDATTPRLAILPEKLNKTTVYSFLPTNDVQFRSVFNKDASLIDREDFATANKYFESQKTTHQFSIAPAQFEAANTIIPKGEGKSDIDIFIGHNERGSLVTPTGQKIDVRELSKQCAVNVVICVFISCRTDRDIYGSASLGVKDLISIREALTILDSVSAIAQADIPKNRKFAEIAHALSGKSDMTHVRIVEAAGVAIVLVLLSDDENLRNALK